MDKLSLTRRGLSVNAGLRWLLIGINIFLLLTGVAMVVLGVKVTGLNRADVTSSLPELWWLGLMPLTIGFMGVLATIVGHPRWLLAWSIYSGLTSIGGYTFFVKSGCFDPEKFGVTMRIYGTCHQESDGCVCVWSSESVTVSTQHPCDVVRDITSLYLSQMILMTLTLAATIIGCFFASVVTCCSRFCVVQTEESQSLLQPGTSSATNTPTHQPRHPAHKTVYMTDYIPPHNTRTYLTDTRHASNSTML